MAGCAIPERSTLDDSLRWADIPAERLNISATLDSGQSFRWREDGIGWTGVVGDQIVRLKPEESGFHWATFPEPGRWDLIESHFALDIDLEPMYAEWVDRVPESAASIERNRGLRVLRQDAEEALFAFMCASCNTVVKIKRTIRALEKRAGYPIGIVAGELYCESPSAARIADIDESDLRADLWGYRAPRLIEIARHAASQSGDWLQHLRSLPYADAQRELTQLSGIGEKIADCICLFGLWHDEAVPVDTHVRKIGVRLFRPDLATKTLTSSVYQTLGDLFRERFGPYAGWAQQYLFYDEMKKVK